MTEHFGSIPYWKCYAKLRCEFVLTNGKTLKSENGFSSHHYGKYTSYTICMILLRIILYCLFYILI